MLIRNGKKKLQICEFFPLWHKNNSNNHYSKCNELALRPLCNKSVSPKGARPPLWEPLTNYIKS